MRSGYPKKFGDHESLFCSPNTLYETVTKHDFRYDLRRTQGANSSNHPGAVRTITTQNREIQGVVSRPPGKVDEEGNINPDNSFVRATEIYSPHSYKIQ